MASRKNNCSPHLEVAFRPCVSGDLHKTKQKQTKTSPMTCFKRNKNISSEPKVHTVHVHVVGNRHIAPTFCKENNSEISVLYMGGQPLNREKQIGSEKPRLGFGCRYQT